MTDAACGRLDDRLEAARAARVRRAGRPLALTAAALAAAAVRWRHDAALARALPAATGLSPEMIAAVLPLAAESLTTEGAATLVAGEWGPGAIERPVPAGPALVACVLASNVPALALPAIALACLAGAAVLVKSGRHDRVSAPAFVEALAAVDPELAETVVATYWAGGDVAAEAVLARADVVVATGGDDALGALARRVGRSLVTHGPRVSVAAVGRDAADDAATLAARLAMDVALHDQRGCLSPRAVWVERGGRLAPRAFAEHLADALAALARRLPLGEATLEERASLRLAREGAAWEPGVTVLAVEGGTVLYDETGVFRPGPGRRTIRVHPLDDLDGLASVLPPGGVECVGLAGGDPGRLVPTLAARRVSRLCPLGRMQRPALSWPRGCRPPLGALLGRPEPAPLEVDAWQTS